MKIEEMIDGFVEFRELIDKIEEEYDRCREQLKDYRGLHHDMAHLIELSNLNAAELVSLTSEYRRLMRKRRKLKDKIEVLKRAMNYINKHKSSITNLSNVNYQMKSRMRELGERTYNTRSVYGKGLIDKYSKDNDGFNKYN